MELTASLYPLAACWEGGGWRDPTFSQVPALSLLRQLLLLSCEVTGASSEIQALGQRRKAERVSCCKSMTLSRFPGRHSALGQHQQFRRKFKATCAHVHTHTHTRTLTFLSNQHPSRQALTWADLKPALFEAIAAAVFFEFASNYEAAQREASSGPARPSQL